MRRRDLAHVVAGLSETLRDLSFSRPVSCVYDPTDYAFEPYSLYLDRYGGVPKEVVLVGMNPGPWGMVQTGIPFGDVEFVRDWMGIEGKVGRPQRLHPARPVQGYSCTRSEVSGTRLWGWARDRFGSAEAFFRRFIVLNYCPLAFFDEAGRNITPDRLAKADREKLFQPCDWAIREMIGILGPQWAIGVGKFAGGRLTEALADLEVSVGRITHPSPANPAANRGWTELVERELAGMGIGLPPNASA